MDQKSNLRVNQGPSQFSSAGNGDDHLSRVPYPCPLRAPTEGWSREGTGKFSSDDNGTVPLSRRAMLYYGLTGLACAACGALSGCVKSNGGAGDDGDASSETLGGPLRTKGAVFKGDAPKGAIWRQWQDRGWAREARHYLKLGENVQCRLCPNECLMAPGDRSHCRVRVNIDGVLYTLAYGNPCAYGASDPIEKKPLFHFLPDTRTFSIAASGCGFRCLNCQNWDISQRKPEEVKDSRGDPCRLNPKQSLSLTTPDRERCSIFPDDVVAWAKYFDTPSIAYTYSEPTVWFEYLLDTAKAARAEKIKNLWITCGYIHEEPLLELCKCVDAANVNLKSFSEEIYEQLNSGKLEPVLNTLKILKREGVWFEVTNLVVPTYTDKPDMIRQMCDWLLTNLGPDYPLHFSRFHPMHKLTHLPDTPKDILLEARDIAQQAGLRYVYIGNSPEITDGETTFCPNCRKRLVEREGISLTSLQMDVAAGKCPKCGTTIAGVWSPNA
jgi:pyruvate formate lyase activating enzyme